MFALEHTSPPPKPQPYSPNIVFHWKQWSLLIDFNGSLRDDVPLMTYREVFRIIIISIIAITPTLSLYEWEREEE